ncbi:MAG: hypothetical protein J3Q66DRAFT_411828 [Benniella sp.]|nr:MAG: hypothetical protein J3Q66DRAFT_411828 [Benniella sp.]
MTLHVDGRHNKAKAKAHQERRDRKTRNIRVLRTHLKNMEKKASKGESTCKSVVSHVGRLLRRVFSITPEDRQDIARGLKVGLEGHKNFHVCHCFGESDTCIARTCRHNPSAKVLVEMAIKTLNLSTEAHLAVLGTISNNDYEKNIPGYGLVKNSDILRGCESEACEVIFDHYVKEIEMITETTLVDDRFEISRTGYNNQPYIENLTEFRRLKSLRSEAKAGQVDSRQLSQIVNGMQQVKSLGVHKYTFGALSLTALRPHFSILRQLKLESAVFETGPSIIPDVLASCPQLEILIAGEVTSEDILQGPPWVCERTLKTLHVGIIISSGEDMDHQQRLVPERISRLCYLEDFSLLGGSPGRAEARIRLLHLGKGLEYLATLKKLRYLHLYELCD